MIRRIGLAALLAFATLLVLTGAAAAATGFVVDETLTEADPSSPQLAVAPNGYAALAWVEGAGRENAVRVALRPPGGPWSAPQLLRTDAQSKFGPTVAVNAAGDAAVGWSEFLASSTAVAVATRSAGDAFGAPQLLTDTRTTFGAAVGVDAAGQVTLLYAPSPAVAVRDFPAGGSALAATPTPLNATGCGGITMRLAVAPSGDAVAGYDCGGAVFALRRDGTWNVSPTIENFGNDCTRSSVITFDPASVAIDAAGNPVGLLHVVNTSPDSLGCAFAASSISESLVLPLAGRMTEVGGPPVVTGFSFGFIGGNPIVAPQAAISPSGIVVSWGDAATSGRSLAMVRFYAVDGSGGSAPQSVGSTPSVQAVSPTLAVAADGRALLAWPQVDRFGADAALVAATRAPGGAFGDPVPVSAGTGGASGPAVGLATTGDGTVAWTQGTGPARLHARGFDATAPMLGGVTIPASAAAGVPATFAASPFDVWGPLTTTWSFGDGATATGATVQHTYARAGRFAATVTVTDAVGNAVSRSGTVRVLAAEPVISGLSLTHRRFRVGRSRTAVSARRRRASRAAVGTTFRFALDRAATVRIAFARPARGLRSGRRCVRPSSRLRRARARRCTRLVVITPALTRTGRAGANAVPFSGRIGRHALAPGRYRATLTATAAGRAGPSSSIGFTVVR
ncbi:MAG TPA: PKD domain-containing protein [Conexibacter sp.]